MQTILISCMAAVIVLLCISSLVLYRRINRFSKRFEQKFQIQHQFNRHFNKRLNEQELTASKKQFSRFFANSIILLFAVSLVSSCSPSENIPAAGIPDYSVVTIEGCEYFLYPVTHGYSSFTHKGNCTNPIHYSGTFKTENR